MPSKKQDKRSKPSTQAQLGKDTGSGVSHSIHEADRETGKRWFASLQQRSRVAFAVDDDEDIPDDSSLENFCLTEQGKIVPIPRELDAALREAAFRKPISALDDRRRELREPFLEMQRQEREQKRHEDQLKRDKERYALKLECERKIASLRATLLIAEKSHAAVPTSKRLEDDLARVNKKKGRRHDPKFVRSLMAKVKEPSRTGNETMVWNEVSLALDISKQSVYDHPRLEQVRRPGIRKVRFTTESVMREVANKISPLEYKFLPAAPAAPAAPVKATK